MLLLVDSHDATREALSERLRDSGYEVVGVHNGLEGLRAVRDRAPSLILLDLWPFFSASLQMLERLRAAESTRDIPVLVVTSPVSDAYRARALAAGCAGYLEKPCAPGAVAAAVRRILHTTARDPLRGALPSRLAERHSPIPRDRAALETE